jgi:hypothetical protein
MIDAGGPDHLSVGVRIPGGRLERPMSNRYLYVVPPGNLQILQHTFYICQIFDSFRYCKYY